MSKIFSIPAGIPFAKALASSLLEEYTDNPDQLPDVFNSAANPPCLQNLARSIPAIKQRQTYHAPNNASFRRY